MTQQAGDIELVDYETYMTLSQHEKMVQRLAAADRVVSAMGLSPEKTEFNGTQEVKVNRVATRTTSYLAKKFTKGHASRMVVVTMGLDDKVVVDGVDANVPVTARTTPSSRKTGSQLRNLHDAKRRKSD